MIKKLLLTSATLLSVTGAFAQSAYTITNRVLNGEGGTATVNYNNVTFSGVFGTPNSSNRILSPDQFTINDEGGILTITCSGTKETINKTEYTLSATSAAKGVQSIKIDNLTAGEVKDGEPEENEDYIAEFSSDKEKYLDGMDFAQTLKTKNPSLAINVLKYEDTTIDGGTDYMWYKYNTSLKTWRDKIASRWSVD